MASPEDLPPARARIPGMIRGVGARQRLTAMNSYEAARQDNWAKHFGGPTSRETQQAADVAARVDAMKQNQAVEDTFRKSQGLPTAAESARTTLYKYGQDDTGTSTKLATTGTSSTGSKTAPPAPAASAVPSVVPAPAPAPKIAGASMGIVERGGVGGSDVRYKNGTTITGTPQKRILTSKYGRGSATTTPAPSATPQLPAVTPVTAAVKAATKIPVVGAAVSAIQRLVGGGKPVSAPAPTAPAPAPAPQTPVPKGATRTASGGFMSITGQPKAPAPPPYTTERRMADREAYAQRQGMAKIYPERTPKAMARAAANRRKVQIARAGDVQFKRNLAAVSPRDRLKINARLAAQTF